MKSAPPHGQREVRSVLLLSGQQRSSLSVVCDNHIHSDCRKGDHKEGTVDFAHLSCQWVYLEQNSRRPPVWKIISCILSLCQVDLTCGRLVRSQFSTLRSWDGASEELQNERCSSPLDLTCSSCSCSLPLRCLLPRHCVCLLFLVEKLSYLCPTFIILGLAIPLHLCEFYGLMTYPCR